MLQLLIVRNYSRRKFGFLRVNCIFIRFFDTGLDPIRPPKTENFVTQPDPTRIDPWVDQTRVILLRPNDVINHGAIVPWLSTPCRWTVASC